jgi:hypothetical protein
MVVFNLSIFEGELPGSVLTCEVMAVGMFAPPSIRTGIQHLSGEVAVVAGHAAPSRGSGQAEMMGCLAMGGEVVEPRAVGTAAEFLVLVLGKGIVLCIIAVPRNSAPCPSPQMQGPMLVVGARLSVMGLVSPCQFPSLAILIYQLQEAFPGVRPYQALAHCLGVSDMCQLVHSEFCSPFLGVSLKGLYFLEAEHELASV